MTHVDELRGGLGSGGGGPFGAPDIGGGPEDVIQGFGAGSSSDRNLRDVLPPPNSDFFTEFFPSTRPANNHPKRFTPSISTPSKEFMQLIYG